MICSYISNSLKRRSNMIVILKWCLIFTEYRLLWSSVFMYKHRRDTLCISLCKKNPPRCLLLMWHFALDFDEGQALSSPACGHFANGEELNKCFPGPSHNLLPHCPPLGVYWNVTYQGSLPWVNRAPHSPFPSSLPALFFPLALSTT